VTGGETSVSERDEPHSSVYYEERLRELELRIASVRTRESAVSWARLAAFGVFAVASWLAFITGLFSGWWTLLPLGIFFALIAVHGRISTTRRQLERRALHNERGVRRTRREWDSAAEGGMRFVTPEHPYSADLDLFGPASIFTLISTARTRAGEATLAGWLLEPAAPEVIEARRMAMREIVGDAELRERVAMLGTEPGVADIEPHSFAHIEPTEWRHALLLRVALVLLSAANFATLVGWLAFGWGALPFLLAVSVSGVVAMILRNHVQRAIAGIEALSGDLDVMAELIELIESSALDAGDFHEIQRELRSGGESASSAIRRLARLVALLDSRRNQLFLPISLLLFWATHLSIAFDQWKGRHAGSVALWVDAIGRFEAILSLSSFAFEHPEFVDARIIASKEPRFDGTAIGHPLIPRDRLVRNDLSLGETRLLIVSGSNMSGKSTLLRTVGVNAVLALAGAPVDARGLAISPLIVGASIHVRDSLIEEKSRFYAEILRLRAIVDLAGGELPLLFLLDEVLHGTNSHDRTIGASAVLRALVQQGAAGLVTTHDLALAKVADDLPGIARNVHFEDHIERDEMVFDYQMREGVVTRSNALGLMRRIGLEV
jgi:hypothetical protein